MSHTFLYLIIPLHFYSLCFEGFSLQFSFNLPLVCNVNHYPCYWQEHFHVIQLLLLLELQFALKQRCGLSLHQDHLLFSFSASLFLMFASLSFDHYDRIAICGSSVDVLVTYLPILFLSCYPYLFFTVLAFSSHSYSCHSLLGLLFINFLVFILFI